MIYIVDLESVPTRYTCEWKEHVPALFKQAGHQVTVIDGPTDIPAATTPGAFLNFGGTNIYKASQVEKISRLFCEGTVQPGDHFLFTDAWHPGIINLKYMSELLRIPVTIHALCHAGSYDPQDFLGRLVGNAAWVRHAEKAFYSAIDFNYFATDFHIKLFVQNLLYDDNCSDNPWKEDDVADALSGKVKSIVKTGWPMEYMRDTLVQYKGVAKKNIVLFPHRIAPEKQLDIFKDLAQFFPDYEFVVAQEKQLSKPEYHKLLAESKMVFSANLQETLGISWYEGAILGAIPVVPDRLSYSEMALVPFAYPSKWTESFESYLLHRDELVTFMRKHLDNFGTESTARMVETQVNFLEQHYFSATNLINNIK